MNLRKLCNQQPLHLEIEDDASNEGSNMRLIEDWVYKGRVYKGVRLMLYLTPVGLESKAI